MKNLSKILTVTALLVVSILFGDMVRKVYFTQTVSNTSIPVLTDTLPLENQGNIKVQLIGNKKVIVISFDDFQYVTKKRKRSKQAVKNVKALFKRLED